MSVVFVFGSNLSGIHGAGAAREAHERWGAKLGFGIGRCGDSYAIPTKDLRIETMPLDKIRPYVRDFVEYARCHPQDSFLVTAIGCGLAGYKPRDIAPMFHGAPENVFLSAKLARGLVGEAAE